jgi:hypothetical protein
MMLLQSGQLPMKYWSCNGAGWGLFSCEPQMDPDWLDRLLATRASIPSTDTLEKV